MSIAAIADSEGGASVRGKLNSLIARENLRLDPYVGFASARGLINDAVASSGSAQQVKARSMDIARSLLTAPRVLFAVGWYVTTSGVETVQAGSYSWQAAIEYPLGSTPQRLTFGGNLTASPTGGDTLVSDALTLSTPIPEGERFAVHFWYSSPSGWIYHNNYPACAGDDFTTGASVADLTGGYRPGSGAPGAVGVCHLGVVETITKHADLDIGDSICHGSGTDERDVNLAFGVLARMTRHRFGGVNAGRSSTRASQFTSSNSARVIALATYASRIKSNYGVNDCLNNVAAATTATELIRIRNLFAGKPFYQTTITPLTTGAWTAADGSDQTVTATSGAIATTLNTLIRAGLVSGVAANISGVLDVRNVVQHPTDEQKWAAGFTTDGIHPKGRVYRMIGSSTPAMSGFGD